METYKDILCRQIDTLQRYFDTCAENLENHNEATKGGCICLTIVLYYFKVSSICTLLLMQKVGNLSRSENIHDNLAISCVTVVIFTWNICFNCEIYLFVDYIWLVTIL